jgi:subtilase family serine protease
MSHRWFSREALLQFVKQNAKRRGNRSKLLGIESLEARHYLSASSLGFATPDYVAVHPADGVTPQSTSGPGGMTPAVIRQAYGFGSLNSSNDGTGTTIAIVDAYDDPNIASDLQKFDAQFGLPNPTFTKVNQNGGATMPTANKSWATEIALDVEWAHAIAPGANILLVEANSSSFSDLLAAVNTARNAKGVVAVSMSWGGGEFSGEKSYDSYFTTPAGHTGVSFFVSSGDDGAPVSYPAASPNVVSVGGTSLYLNGNNYSSEAAWSGSGGGISSYEAQPGYQKGIVTQSTTARTNPDVSYDADPSTGFPVYDSYNNGTARPWGEWGGTSDAAPQWAALVAIADQGRAAAGLGSLDGASQLLPALYKLPASDFHDVTTGNSSGSPAYSASAGYDLATGRGTPVANRVIADLINLGGSTQTTAPTAPANFTAQATSSTQVAVSWSLSTGATSYNVYAQTGTGQPVLVGSFGASTTSTTVNNLTAGASYSFQLVALNSAGSGATNWLAVTMPSATLAAPGNFTVNATSSTQVTVSWSLSTGATSYNVYAQTGTGQPVLVGTYGASTTSATIGNLTAGASYSFQVVASNATSSAATNWLAVTMPDSGSLVAPQRFTVTATSTTTAHLSWSASAGATSYSVYWWNGSQAALIGTVGAGTTSVNVRGLTPGSTDQFYITASNSSGSASTAWVSVVMPGAATLASPQNVTATAISNTAGQLSWNASAGASGYLIYWWNGFQAVQIGNVGSGTTSVNVQGLTANSTNSFLVVAYNATSSSASSWVNLTTPAYTTFNAPLTALQAADFLFAVLGSNGRWSTG